MHSKMQMASANLVELKIIRHGCNFVSSYHQIKLSFFKVAGDKIHFTNKLFINALCQVSMVASVTYSSSHLSIVWLTKTSRSGCLRRPSCFLSVKAGLCILSQCSCVCKFPNDAPLLSHKHLKQTSLSKGVQLNTAALLISDWPFCCYLGRN